MKKLFQILFLIQFILISCNKKSEEKSFTKKESEIIKTESKIDSTKVREYAEAILKNEVYPTDNDETFECIKQMFTNEKDDLEFYFKVFRIIVEKSDGALSEAIGIEIMSFLKYNPDFFIEQYSEFKLEEKQKFIGFMASEFYFTEPNHNAEIKQYFSEVSSKIKHSTELKRKYLNSIKELTKVETEKIIKE